MKELKNRNPQDLVVLLGISLIGFGALYCTFFCSFTSSVESIVWILWLVLTVVLGYFTSIGKGVLSFMQESKVELMKVVWPSRQETLQTTSIVMVMVAVTGFVLWGTNFLHYKVFIAGICMNYIPLLYFNVFHHHYPN